MTQFCYFKMLRKFRKFQTCLHKLLDQKYAKAAKLQDNRKKTRQQQKCINNAETFLRPRELAVKNNLYSG